MVRTVISDCMSFALSLRVSPHGKQPSSYYICHNGQATLLTCGPNKVFDAGSQKCISEDFHSKRKVLDTSSCLRDSDVIPHEINCNLYYTCNAGKRVLQNCPVDLNFGFEEQVCAWTAPGCIGSRDGHIGIRQTPDDPTDLTDSGDYPNGCPRNHHIHRLLPHEYNCQKFYYCVHGRRSVARICPSILVFDNELQVCVWPWDTDCSNQNGGSSESAGSGEASPGTDSSSEPEQSPEEFGTNGCPKNFYGSYHLPYPNDCGKFHTCVHGEKILENCVPGLHFDFDKQSCVWPWETNCSGGSGGGEGTGSSSAEQPNGSEPGNGDGNNSGENESNGSGSEQPDSGPDNGDGNNSGDNESNVSSPEQPGSGADNGDGNNSGENESNSSSPEQPGSGPDNGDGNNSGENESNNSSPEQPDSEPDNGDGNNSGDNESNVSSPEQPGSEPDNGDGNNSGENENNGASPEQPGSGSQPDNGEGDNSEENATDGSAGGFSGENASGAGSSESNDASTEPPSSGAEPDNGGGSNSEEEGAGGISEEDAPGAGSGETYENGCPVNHYVTYLQSHRDCSKFYTCVYGEKVVQNCPAGLLFNYEKQACVWTWESDCEGNIGGGTSEPDNGNGNNSGENESNSSSPEQPGSVPDNGDGNNSGDNESTGSNPEQPGSGSQPDNGEGDNSEDNATDGPAGGSSGENAPEVGSNESTDASGEQPGPGSEPGNGSGGNSAEEGTGGASEENSPGAEPGESYENGCPVNQYVTYLQSHEDCSKFYRCVHGHKIVQHCPAGLLFNYKKQACVWPWESNCEGHVGGGGSETDNGGAGNSGEVGGSPGQPDNGDSDSAEEGTGGSSGETAPGTVSGETYENGCPVNNDRTYLQSHEDCSKFYSCVHGHKIVQHCPEGLFFNYEKQACVWSWESDCTKTDSSSASHETEAPESAEAQASSEETGGSGSEPGSGGGSVNECPAVVDGLYLVPHETDCSLFYACVGGNRIQQNCYTGLKFSYKEQACVWPWESECEASAAGGDGKPEGSSESNGSSVEQPDSEPDNGDGDNSVEEGTGGSSGENAPGAEPSATYENGCPVNHYVTYLQAHEDCSKFYSCVYGEKVVQHCVQGLLFNYKQQACVWPWESDCVNTGGSSGSDETVSSESEEVQEPSVSSEETGGSSSQAGGGDSGSGSSESVNKCPAVVDGLYLIPHETDCSLFYACVGGNRIQQNCYTGLKFSYKEQACVWPWESECEASAAGGDGKPEGSSESNGSSVEQPDSAPDNGGGDNSVEEGTGGSSGENAPGAEPSGTYENGCPVNHYVTYLQVHEDCSKFYSCVYGEKVVQHCVQGLLFNYKQQACVWPWESDCVNTGGSSGSDESVSSKSEEVQEPSVSSEETGGSSSQPGGGDSGSGSSESVNKCPAVVDGLYLIPHETDCSLFYACVGGNRIQQNCYTGLKFSYKEQACVWPWESECEANTGGGDGSLEGSSESNSSSGTGSSSGSDESVSSESEEAQEPSVSSEEADGSGSQPGGSGGSGGDGSAEQVTEASAEEQQPSAPSEPITSEVCKTIVDGRYNLPYEDSCTRFYSCVGGILKIQNCPSGTYFSNEKQLCVWPWDSECYNAQ